MNERELRYRNELKYAVTEPQIVLLQSSVRPLLQLDPHADVNGSYSVRSLYFDDIYRSCYYDNENGVTPREKFRIRIYNGSNARIMLECKRKERGKTLKSSCLISKEQAWQLMLGENPESSEQSPVLRKLTLQMQTRALRPAVIVEYDRTAYVCSNGNVRITFDTAICSSSDVSRFFDQEISKRPIMPVGQHLMEVKYDAYLPDPIYAALNLSSLRQETYSKYYLCRKFKISGGSYEHF